MPVSDLVSILEKLLKVKAKRRVMKLPRNGDVPFTHANISLAQREFGYKPTTDLQTGLKKFVKPALYENKLSCFQLLVYDVASSKEERGISHDEQVFVVHRGLH
ncbi:putative UDP-glucuronate 4-epimerase [Helianthus annuus]|nr:putative UDP-glucuronate 4-epimerase [Helianthus annuus]